MIKILFICHGNICRSPMAEYVMKDLVKKAGQGDRFEIASAAVSREELGNPVYPPAWRELQRHGISCDGHRAHQITRKEYEYYDYIYYMDRSNARYLSRLLPDTSKCKAKGIDHTPKPQPGPQRYRDQKKRRNLFRKFQCQLHGKEGSHGMAHDKEVFMFIRQLKKRGSGMIPPLIHTGFSKIPHRSPVTGVTDIDQTPVFRNKLLQRKHLPEMIRAAHNTMEKQHRIFRPGDDSSCLRMLHKNPPFQL